MKRGSNQEILETISDTMQGFLDLAQNAFASQRFDAIIQSVSELPEEIRCSPLVLAWLGRAQFECGAVTEARCRLVQAVALSSDLPDWAKLTLQHAAWKDDSDFSEELPTTLRSEMELFGCVVDRLIARGEAGAALSQGRFTPATLAMYWVKRGIRTVALDAMRKEAAGELLLLRLSEEFLAAASKGANKVAEVCAALSGDVPFTRQDDAAPRVFDVACAVVLRAKPVLCPFSGRRGLARDSIDLSAYRYMHDGRACLILQDSTAARAASDSAWYFPGDRVLLVAQG